MLPPLSIFKYILNEIKFERFHKRIVLQINLFLINNYLDWIVSVRESGALEILNSYRAGSMLNFILSINRQYDFKLQS